MFAWSCTITQLTLQWGTKVPNLFRTAHQKRFHGHSDDNDDDDDDDDDVDDDNNDNDDDDLDDDDNDDDDDDDDHNINKFILTRYVILSMKMYI